MRHTVRTLALLSICVVGPSVATAQPTIDLAGNAADPVFRGVRANAHAGATLDVGAVHHGDNRRDLIIGAPGGPGVVGSVYLLFGGPTRHGDLPLSDANAAIDGAAAGDLFGFATAVGHVRSLQNPPALIVSAPAAQTNRGRVYVFAGGFRYGDRLTAANAVAQIVGNTGDQLGTSLATADLNNDGYAEIIIGAPGTGRIYVIAGGSALAGTTDLSVTPAAVTFSYPGLGVNVSSGDITGDGISDVLAGHPALNAVHVLKGRNGSMPPAGFDMTFGGIDAGDGVGSSVRLADVDSDGKSDIIVGAPSADGPSNTRPDAGEVYLIWGGAAVTGRSLHHADVTFFGATSHNRFGAMLAGGDINRDNPDDLVFVSTGARGGAGALDLYYGRKRTSIGVPRGDGPRVVDFASELPDRVILGDTDGGTITAAQVFEVTGEGARDVIVGMSGNNGGVGAVYFTISPRLEPSKYSVSLSAYQGFVTSSPETVNNISEIAISWRTTSNRAWLSATPEGSARAGSPGSMVITANASGLAPGTHTGNVTISSTSNHLIIARTIAVTLVVGETQPTPASPPASGFPPGAIYNLFWRHTTEGWLAAWHMNGLTFTGSSTLSINRMTATSWRIAGIGDLNGDGHVDIMWQDDSGGWLAAWYLQGTQVVFTGYLSINRMADANWKIRGVGDTNGDRKADLVWQNGDDGRLAVWYMNGTQVTATIPLSIPRMSTPQWFIKAVGDTNGDGRADILWHKGDTGELAVWYLNGATVTGTHRLSIGSMTDTNWSIAGATDVNGDRKADILWQHAAGRLATWYLDGHTVTATLMLNPDRVSNTAWRIAGPK